ncbi:extracellular dioxygenase [Xylogone sp. PMI_703]|nr:extracellular dioxygenase [Xylogone sp. PMI_703]
MVHIQKIFYTSLVGLAALIQAHPGHDVASEAAERAAVLKKRRSIAHCGEILKARGFEAKNIARRQLAVQQLRVKRAVKREALSLNGRDLGSLNTSHFSSLDVNFDTNQAVLFASNATCILGPDVTQGPHYVTGELIRENVVEDQEGVPLFLDIQLVDSVTCDPVPQAFVDIWHCNSTGVYSGVIANGNGNFNDSTNINNTFLRGIQQTDNEGVVKFETLFPGHYTGRATHIHVLSHATNETERLANNTVSGLYTSHASHVGQLFFDQDLISEVEAQAPYKDNTQPLTQNADDSILLQEADDIDPFVQYVYVSDNVADGIFAWISLAINSTEDSSVTPAAWLTPSGGVANPDSGFGSGAPGGPPNGSSIPFPSSTAGAA